MLLAIDTSLGTAVALVEDDGMVLAAQSSDDPLGHAETIGGMLQSALVAAASAPESSGEQLSYVAIGMGPGPFTGLRVGIAAARAFALGRGIPVVPVPSHDAIALDLLLAAALRDERAEALTAGDASHDAQSHGRFAVVTDARRREFAFTVYGGIDDDGLPVRATEPALIARDALDDRLAELGAKRKDAARVPAEMVALAASRAVLAGRSLTGSEPLYLRSPDVTLSHVPKRVGT